MEKRNRTPPIDQLPDHLRRWIDEELLERDGRPIELKTKLEAHGYEFSYDRIRERLDQLLSPIRFALQTHIDYTELWHPEGRDILAKLGLIRLQRLRLDQEEKNLLRRATRLLDWKAEEDHSDQTGNGE